MLERLTNRTKYGVAYTKIPVDKINMVDIGECYAGDTIDRLAAYEDSGLSPEEVQEIARAKADGLMNLMEKPEIVCLCGSTRFTDLMLIIQWEFTKQGKIVLSWCALPESYFKAYGYDDTTHIGEKENVKELVDEVHKRKIDLCDYVFVINKDGYIGESTKSEIEYALSLGKVVRYFEN